MASNIQYRLAVLFGLMHRVVLTDGRITAIAPFGSLNEYEKSEARELPFASKDAVIAFLKGM